ncbi:MAG: hypothetical protein HQL58_12070, partial [Magnetococcales bacterium]|nr:hypothetical protein [Magnetococcales bacterium]
EASVSLWRLFSFILRQAPYRDIFQRAFYGQALDKLSILCEDAVAESLILGALDYLNPHINLTPSDVSVGRNTGKDQFPQHIEAIGKFRQLDAFVFVLDGDVRNTDMVIAKMKEAGSRAGHAVEPIFLPGNASPEQWIYDRLEQQTGEYAELFGLPVSVLRNNLQDIRQLYLSATDKPADVAKNQLQTLAETIQRDVGTVARHVGYAEAGRGDMNRFVEELKEAINRWRMQYSGGHSK